MNRKRYVVVDKQASIIQFIKCCVPQGSVLGPVLFLLFINDICNVSNLVRFVLFADDTNIFCSNESVEVLQYTLNRKLAKRLVCFSINIISLNLGKTNYMMFRSRPPDIELHLKINNAEIPKLTATKFLGIIIDGRLNWKPHIQSVKFKLSSILTIMYKASKLITTAGMYTLCCALFQPHISYCNEIWGNNYASDVNCLCIIQRSVVRLICKADRLAYTNELFN